MATLVILPQLASFRIRAALMGANRALIGSSQLLSLVPGLPGQYLRRAFLARVLEDSWRQVAPERVIEQHDRVGGVPGKGRKRASK